MKTASEADITKAVRILLKAHGIWHFKHWGGPMSVKGISDIIGIFEGRPLYIEIKKPGGHVSQEQLAFLKDVRAAGGIAFIATSTTDVIQALGLPHLI